MAYTLWKCKVERYVKNNWLRQWVFSVVHNDDGNVFYLCTKIIDIDRATNKIIKTTTPKGQLTIPDHVRAEARKKYEEEKNRGTNLTGQ